MKKVKEYYKTRGKLNRLTIGREVQATVGLVDWYSKHLVWFYGAPVGNDPAYPEDGREIAISDLTKVYVWARAKLSGELPKGIVSHYGSVEGIPNKKCVWVRFLFKTELGPIEYGTYVGENRVKLLKKKIKRK
jgi:hypothetical protein